MRAEYVQLPDTKLCDKRASLRVVLDESCHTHEWVMSHIWMSHVTHMNESCHTYEWVMSHIRMSHVTYVKRHVTHMNESWHMCFNTWKISHRSASRKVFGAACVIHVNNVIHMWCVTHIHRKSSLYLPLSSVNLVLSLMGTPDGISTRSGWNRVSRWWCRVSPGIYILSWLKL